MRKYGAQVLTRPRSADQVYVAILCDDGKHITLHEIFSGPTLSHAESNCESVMGEDFPIYVVMPDGVWIAPEFIGVFEALETAYADRLPKNTIYRRSESV